MFILALVITIAVVVTRNSDDDQDEEAMNTSPGRPLNRNDFLALMLTFDGPINGKNFIEFFDVQFINFIEI